MKYVMSLFQKIYPGFTPYNQYMIQVATID